MSLDDARLTESPPPAQETRAKPKTSIRYQRHLARIAAAKAAARKRAPATKQPPTKTKRASRKGAALSKPAARRFLDDADQAAQYVGKLPTGRPKGRKDAKPRKRALRDGQARLSPARASREAVFSYRVWVKVPLADSLIINSLAEQEGVAIGTWFSDRALEAVARETGLAPPAPALGAAQIGLFRRIRLAWHLACGKIPRRVRRSIAAWDRDLRAKQTGRK